MNPEELSVERLAEFSEADAAGIGRLMSHMSQRLSSEPMNEGILRAIIESPYHDQLVARLNGIIVGTATMNLLMGPGASRLGYLEDFVTDSDVRGQGVGERIWQGIIGWCQEQGVDLEFTSHPRREAAHRFYLNRGAEIKNTTVFHLDLSLEDETHQP